MDSCYMYNYKKYITKKLAWPNQAGMKFLFIEGIANVTFSNMIYLFGLHRYAGWRFSRIPQDFGIS